MRTFHLLALPLLTTPLAAQTTLFEVRGNPRDFFGSVCDLVGDTNGDGHSEFLVGAFGSQGRSGSLFVYSGVDGTLLASFLGSRVGAELGFGSSAAGDVNGDGFFDVCAAEHLTFVPGVGSQVGKVRIVSGADSSVLRTVTGSTSGEAFGTATAALGDVNGDGRDDVLVGAVNAREPFTTLAVGSLTVLSGADGSVLQRVFGDSPGGQLGQSVSGVGDVNGDGIPDFAGVETPAGRPTVRVFSGADGSELLRRFAGGDVVVVAGGADANADGFDDVLLSRIRLRTTVSPPSFFVLSGRDGSILWSLGVDPAEASPNQYDVGITGCGDLDGDGYGDWAVGVPGFDGPAGTDTGAVRAFSGRTGRLIAEIPGSAAGDRLGSALASGRDVNGDGVFDVIAASSYSNSAAVLSFVPRGVEVFGSGTAGCDGPLALGVSGVPTLGNAAFEVHLSHAGPTGFLLIGDTEDTLGTLHFGARFHLQLAPPPPGLGVVESHQLPAPDATGSITLALPMPADPVLLGKPFVFQGVSLFPPGTCAQRLATTNGLRVTAQ